MPTSPLSEQINFINKQPIGVRNKLIWINYSEDVYCITHLLRTHLLTEHLHSFPFSKSLLPSSLHKCNCVRKETCQELTNCPFQAPLWPPDKKKDLQCCIMQHTDDAIKRNPISFIQKLESTFSWDMLFFKAGIFIHLIRLQVLD